MTKKKKHSSPVVQEDLLEELQNYGPSVIRVVSEQFTEPKRIHLRKWAMKPKL